MADIDKSLPNQVRTEVELPAEEVVEEEVVEQQGPVEVTPEEDRGVTLNFEPTQIVGIKGLVSDDQREKHAKADGTIVNVNEFLIGESPLVKRKMPYAKDEFEVIGGTDGRVIHIYQTYRKYNRRVKVFYKHNETYDPNYAKA